MPLALQEPIAIKTFELTAQVPQVTLLNHGI